MPVSHTLLIPRASRLPVRVDAEFVCGARTVVVTLVNLTTYGFMAETLCELAPGEIGTLALAGGETLTAEVRWCEGDRFGARFTPALRTFILARILSLS
ncbi:MAG TPA: PilZ domain-containing protein [Allosphingosinicella sp.]|jgi:hypothetical protein